MMIMIDMTSQLIEYTAYFGTLYFSYHAAEFSAKYMKCVIYMEIIHARMQLKYNIKHP